MKGLFGIIFTGLAASSIACASPQATEPTDGASTAASLVDFYDSIWIRSEDRTTRSLDEVADDLSKYDVVFFGEFHGHSGIHLAQMQLFRALQERGPAMTLSLEQFERDTQPLLDQYLADEIGEKALQEEGRAWDNYEQNYRPLVEYAKEHKLPVIAANAPKSIVICVGRNGPEMIEDLPQPDRGWIADELHLDTSAYLKKYRRFISDNSTHQKGSGEADEQSEADEAMAERMEAMTMRSFAAQVTRDDTMAESIANHLKSNPERSVFHLNGNFHSASHLGTVERLKLRMPELEIAVVTPVVVENRAPTEISDEDADSGDYIIRVKPVPEMFISSERKLEYQRKVVKKRMGNECVYSKESTQSEGES